MQLVVDTFINGKFDGTRATPGIAHELDHVQLMRGGWIIDQTLRTRHRRDSRFHVYLCNEADRTERAALIFRFERAQSERLF